MGSDLFCGPEADRITKNPPMELHVCVLLARFDRYGHTQQIASQPALGSTPMRGCGVVPPQKRGIMGE